MITRLQTLYFKGLKYIDVKLRPFNILIGPNASGKSTFLDVFVFLRDVLENGPVAAIEKRSSDFAELIWNREKNYFEIAIEFEIPKEKNRNYKFARYEISIAQKENEGVIIENEQLWLLKSENLGKRNRDLTLFPQERKIPEHIVTKRKNRAQEGWRKIVSKSDQGKDYFRSENTGWNIIYRFGPKKSSLARVPEDESKFSIALWVRDILMDGIQFLQLYSLEMRWPCRPDASISFETSGSNLPKILKNLRQEKLESYKRWMEHVQTALPDVAEIQIKERQEDRFLFIQIRYNNGIVIPSWLLSDGTLRLLAQTVIAYLPIRDRLFILEEPENGLHPLAIESAIQSLSSIYDNQVFLATHSPIVLRLAEPKDILCFSKTSSGAVDVINGKDHPKLKDWKEEVDLATLHAAGVLQ